MSSGSSAASQAQQAQAQAMAAAQTNPAALDPYGAQDETASSVLAPYLSVTIAFIVINTLFLVLRFFTVLKLRKRRIPLAWDDWLLVFAYPFVIGALVCTLVIWYYETTDGALAHEPLVQPWRLWPILKSSMALAEIGLPAMILTRYSVLALYLRLFTDRFVRSVTYVLIVLYSMYWVAYGIVAILQCHPVDYYWNRFLPTAHGTCWDIRFSRSVSPPHIVFDLAMIILPLHFIWKLRISAARKLGLTMVIFTGIGAFVVTVVRTVILSKNTNELEAPYLSTDFLTWMVLEPSLYFVTACLPAMLPLFRCLVPRALRPQPRRNLGPISSVNGVADQSAGNRANSRAFLRLRDDTPLHTNKAQITSRSQKDVEMTERELEDNIRMQDLKNATQGEGIVVHTAVTVEWTTEERIEEILDLY